MKNPQDRIRHLFPIFPAAIVMIGGLLASSPAADAALLVYEGFNGYTNGIALGTGANANPNANTIGLNQSVAYAGNGVGNYTATSTGLTFGPLVTSGGAVKVTTTTAVAAAQLSLTTTVTGTLYSSYLINITTMGTTSGNGFETRISNDITTGGARFRAYADSRNSTSTNAAVQYSGTDSAVSTNASTGLILGTTYIVISSYTNVGIEGTTANPGVATLYALTLEQFQNLIASTDWDSYLASATVGTGATSISVRVTDTSTSGTAAFASGNYAQLVSVGDVATIDELRYGTTLADVLPIPEPGAPMLGMVALLSTVWMRRRKS